MKALNKIKIVFALLSICALSVRAQGVISDDAAIITLDGLGQYLMLTNSINPSQGRYGNFAIQITPQSASQFIFSYAGIAEEYALFAVTAGMVIDPAFTAATTPLVSNNGVDPSSSLQTFSLGQSRYFGYWDDRQFSGIDPGIHNTPDIYDNYGWVLLTRSVSGLQVSSSATAIGGGITVGTFTQVPEPSSSLLILFSLSFYLVVWRLGFRFPKLANQHR